MNATLREAHELRCARRQTRISDYTIAGTAVRVCERAGDRLSAMVWPSSEALCTWLAETGVPLAGRRVIELGAGTGIVSVWCALRGARVVATDISEALPLIRECVDQNADQVASAKGECEVRALDWRCDEDISALVGMMADDSTALVVASDVIYDARLGEPLVNVIRVVLARAACETAIAYRFRSREDMTFFKCAAASGLSVDTVWRQCGDALCAAPHGHSHVLRLSGPVHASDCPRTDE